ncbi:hypothetical protein TrLO_g11360 [Triparma laevis f. longispina]|uniref:Ankyrin repeat protein n=1 Tax=Triparma laevis f. longispina TaxID=1714387 RepID=A0A9W7C5E6_9STRA|nr:hypothetical protein TrLO_g11360 [Triparma laevis f. longispina]
MTTLYPIVASNRASRPPKPPKPPETSHLPPWHDRNFQCSEEQRSLAQKFVSACKQNNIKEVKHLLNEALVPVNSGESGCCGHFPAIIEAIKLGHVELTNLLLLRGAKPEHEECMGPPCSQLISCGLQKLQKLKNVGGRTQLQNEKIISALLLHYYSKFWGEKSSDWNLGEIRAIECGETPMVVAVEEYWNYFDEARSNKLEIIRLLINAGAVQTEDEWEETLEMYWNNYLWENEGGGEYLAFSNAIHDEQFLAIPAATLLMTAKKCHPFRVKKASIRFKRIGKCVGKLALALRTWYEEISYRPGNSGMLKAQAEFEQLAMSMPPPLPKKIDPKKIDK